VTDVVEGFTASVIAVDLVVFVHGGGGYEGGGGGG